MLEEMRDARFAARIVGLKDSSGDIPHMIRMIKAVRPNRPDFSFLTGWDAARFEAAGFRAVPGCTVRKGSFLARNVVLTPSFVNIGAQGSATLVVVAPGIAEALIATAVGLLAAIPAVMAYNYFIRRIRVIESETEAFAADYLNIVKRHFLQ